jgi:hypothetical protein
VFGRVKRAIRLGKEGRANVSWNKNTGFCVKVWDSLWDLLLEMGVFWDEVKWGRILAGWAGCEQKIWKVGGKHSSREAGLSIH